jgi:NhaP-type Na+/H+ and K+/H+ antiporter
MKEIIINILIGLLVISSTSILIIIPAAIVKGVMLWLTVPVGVVMVLVIAYFAGKTIMED